MPSTHRGWRTRFVAAALVAAGTAASVLVAASVASGNASATEEWLEVRGEAVVAATESTIDGAVNMLTALAAFLENSPSVDRESFSGFVQSLDSDLRLLAMGYLAVVPGDELRAYEAARREEIAGYTISVIGDDTSTQPVPEGQDAYYPVELFHGGPLLTPVLDDGAAEDTLLGVGFDAGAWEAWRVALGRAVASDEPIVSDFVVLGAGDRDVGRAFLIAVPVHDEAGSVVGLVAAPMIDLLLTSLADRAVTSGVDWRIHAATIDAANGVSGPTWEHTLELPGAVWHVVVVPTEDSRSELSGTPTWIVLLVGLLLTGALVYLYLLISQRRRAKQRVAEMEALAIERDRFLASVSHELRTPLTVVTGLAHELHDHPAGFSDGEKQEILTMLVDQSDEVAAIVEDLLVAARADLGTLSLRPQPVDLASEATRSLQGSFIEAPVPDEEMWAWADPSRVRQILRNLLSNAHRYGGKEIEVRLGRRHGTVWIAVADSGPPIPEDQRNRMFEAYETSSDQSGSRVGAMGLGLFISQRLAEMNGGTLAYEHDGHFGVFTLSLPAGRPPSPPETSAAAQSAGPTISHQAPSLPAHR